MSGLVYGFIGLGLIGGSIAKAIKQEIMDAHIVAYDVNEQTLFHAANDHIIDEICLTINERLNQCDFIFLCAPVSKNTENLLLLKKYLSKNCILTDVGSVKSHIHEQITALGLDSQFIGGHPMAGSERFGYQNSKPELLKNAYYILTPTAQVDTDKIENYSSLVKRLGAIPLVLPAKEHDYVTAAISHLPHVIASSLVNLVRDSDSPQETMKLIAAGGFKDITRIASSSPSMWQQICLSNTDNISKLLTDYINSLNQIKSYLEEGKETELYNLFDHARIYRDSFADSSSGPIKISYMLQVDIADEPGALATIASILALSHISIKNIGIVHNREVEEGTLLIEFYEESALSKAKKLLNIRGYHIYTKKS
ncbi:prephenate dehydrogenase [Lachnospiraceae bacterium OttesenSCG-928-D06]|nr:prephenate dehydrogenase [Lachnospiraceae bacterium OttesenSCG-928-D06]